jgi:hypothetical protein
MVREGGHVPGLRDGRLGTRVRTASAYGASAIRAGVNPRLFIGTWSSRFWALAGLTPYPRPPLQPGRHGAPHQEGTLPSTGT